MSRHLLVATMLLLIAQATAGEQTAAQSDAAVIWITPAAGEPVKRTEEEKEFGRMHGRPTPVPELLQPTIDPGLVPFSPREDQSIRASYSGGASAILPGLVERWIEGFQAHYPNVDFKLNTPYAGSLGMLEVIAGNYDFVFVSRELKPTDIISFKEKYGYAPFTIPISGAAYRHYGFLDALAVFVHPDNPIDRINFRELDAIFSATGHRGGEPIETWGDLGLTGNWADKPVNAYGIAAWNGFEEFVRQRVLSTDTQRGEWGPDVTMLNMAFPIAKAVTADPYGIGYTGIAYLNSPVKVLPLSATDANGPYIAPTYENVANASYPLSRLMYFNTNKHPDEELPPAVRELLRFIVSKEGQEIVLQHAIYLPLRAHQQTASMQLLGN